MSALTLTRPDCSFAFRPLGPRALLLTIAGRDTGTLAIAALDALRAAFVPGAPLQLFVDARSVAFVAPAVSALWTAFLQANQAHFERFVVHTGSRFVQLVVETARHFSRSDGLLQVLVDPVTFDAAVARATAGEPGEWWPAPAPAPVQREGLEGGALRLSRGDCSYLLQRPRPGVVRLTVTGHDDGALGDAVPAELRAERARFGPFALFIDLRAVDWAPGAVTGTWTAFLGEARAWLTQVRVLTGSRSIHVSVAISRERTGAGDWLTLDESPARFEAALTRLRLPRSSRA